MSVNPLHLPVKKDVDTIRKTVLTNIVKMLNKRKWILDKNVEKYTELITNAQNDDQIYKVHLDVSLSNVETYYPTEPNEERKKEKDFEDNVVMIKLFPQKVTSIGKSPIIMEFFTNYKKYHRILIIDSISEKAKQQAMSVRHIEIFTESFFMLDLMEIVCSPQYEVLTPAQGEELLKSYFMTRRQMKKMWDNDPASLYLFLKKKQIVRIIRDSELTGKSIDYRIVVPKSG